MAKSDLRLSDLSPHRRAVPSKLLNVSIPRDVAERLDHIRSELGATKTDVVIALLNEGLDAATEKGIGRAGGTKARANPRRRRRGRRSAQSANGRGAQSESA